MDPKSVVCTQELKRRYFPDDDHWKIQQGSVLDTDFMQNLGLFDIVYSWDVLHHTGAMWLGIEHALQRVSPDGYLYIAIYNDEGAKSHMWWLIKHVYQKLPRVMKKLYAYTLYGLVLVLNILKYILKLQPRIAI